jgi:sec-independent protein translocase protein TatA
MCHVAAGERPRASALGLKRAADMSDGDTLTPATGKPRISTGFLANPQRASRALGKPAREVHMPGKLGLPEILVILAIALLIFGPSKLADLGKGLGEGIKNFKSAVKDGEQDPDKKA